ncbi:MAG: hypothetical protein Q8898_13685 [Bacillota bacterium]|nr:hypothetical protein [Bacillota bacterium]
MNINRANYLFVEQTVFSEKNSVEWSGRREDSRAPAESEAPGAQINRTV